MFTSLCIYSLIKLNDRDDYYRMFSLHIPHENKLSKIGLGSLFHHYNNSFTF